MEIKLENIKWKIDEEKIFDELNLEIPCRKIIGLGGNKYNYFIKLLKEKDFNCGKLIDNNDYLKNVIIFKDYDSFVTNIVFDEFYLKLKYNDEVKESILNILNKFNLNINFLNRHISSLSNLEKRLINLIIGLFHESKTIIFIDLFDGLDFSNKKIFIKLIKAMRNDFNKTIFIYDKDMDTIYNLVDYYLVIDNELVVIDKIDQVLNNKGINGLKIKNINDLIKEVERNV